MSRIEHYLDNGPIEGFWEIIKAEMYQLYEINDYIRFYSTEQSQNRYHCKTPLEVKNGALKEEIIQEYSIAKNKRIEKQSL